MQSPDHPTIADVCAATRREEDWTWRGAPLHVPFYTVGKHKVWGATAIVLAESLALLSSQIYGEG
jgi:hypothetical protein